MGDAQQHNDTVAHSTVAKASWRILPLIGLAYLVAWMDRMNIGFAAIQMNDDLKFSATVYGLGGGLFFLSYALFEIPSNLLLVRFGARRWIARIMITWGLLAAGMMFVRTPLQFYVMRFVLGFAEAGFFPGVIYYLSHWFPMAHRGRAISRFYIAGALSSVVMGGISSRLLDLDGVWSLRGWQWLFLVQGLPAAAIGVIVLLHLPDAPESVSWLTRDEKDWIRQELARDAIRIGEPVEHDVLAALRNPLVLQLGAIGFLTIGAYVAFVLSAPSLLAHATGLDTKHVGYLVSCGGILGALGMLFTGWYTDRRGGRFNSLLTSTLMLAGAYLAISMAASPAVVMVAYLAVVGIFTSVTLATWMVSTDILHIRLLAVGSAAVNSMSQVGAFVGPYIWGATKDATGSYSAGLQSLPVVTLVAAALIYVLYRRVRGARPVIGKISAMRITP